MQEKPLQSHEVLLASEQTLRSAQEFLRYFAINVDPKHNPEEFQEALKQIDPRYEGGSHRERYELEKDAEKDSEKDPNQWPENTIDVIMRTAVAMEMVALDSEGRPQNLENPLLGNYDAVIVLGGARQANLDRVRYALDCQKKQQASWRNIIIAGSDRVLKPAEVEATANYAPGAQTEFDLCAAAEKVAAYENPGMIINLMRVEGAKGIGTPEIIDRTLSALINSNQLPEQASVAAVTTQIYRQSTEIDLARIANRYGIEQTFTAGNPSDEKIIANRTPATYLSEIVRTLKAAAMAFQEETA